MMERNDEPRDFDDVLKLLKTRRYNITIFVLCSLSNARIPPQALSGAFVAPALNFTCVPPPPLNTCVSTVSTSSTTSPASEASTPRNCSFHSQCHYMGPEGLQPCQTWNYDSSVFQETVTSEYNMVCDRAYLRSSYSSIYMAGALVGSLTVGYLADWKGRKLVLILGVLGYTVLPLMQSWVPSLHAILLCRLLMGFFHPLVITSFYTLALETCEPRHRAAVGILTALPWALGTMAWGGIGYLIRDWKWLNFAAALPSVLFLPCLWVLDESPRWLVVQGQHDRAMKVLQGAAAVNGTSLPSEARMRAIMAYTQQHAASSSNMLAGNWRERLKKALKQCGVIFSTEEMRRRLFIMWLLFFVASMVFYGLSLSAVNLSANPYVYMSLGGLMEIPAYTVTVPIINYFGRKRTTSTGYLVCGVSILVITFIPHSLGWLVMTLAMISKLSISMAYQIIYMYVLELLPTEVRLQGLGTSMFLSRVGSVISPFITDQLGEQMPWFPTTIFGMASIVAGLCTLALPETNRRHMVDTVAELGKQVLANNDNFAAVN